MPLKLFTIRIPQVLAERVKIRAVKERVKLQALTARAFETYLRTPLAAHGGWAAPRRPWANAAGRAAGCGW